MSLNARDLMLRAMLVRLRQQEHILLLTMHHIAHDGWSLGILFRELSELYTASVTGREPALKELPIQYADYSEWQRQWLQGEVFEQQLSYWKQQLEGSQEVLPLATDRPRPARRTYRGAQESLLLPKDLAAGLKSLSRQERMTLFMTLLGRFRLCCIVIRGKQTFAWARR